MTNQRLRLTVLALISGLTLAACSSGSSGVHLQSIDPPASATLAPVTHTPSGLPSSAHNSLTAPTGSIATPSSSSTSPPSAVAVTPSTSAPPGVTTSGTTSSTSNPWPASFTAVQQKDAKAALAAFTGFVKVATAAKKDPGKNWTAELRKHAADPTVGMTLDQLASLTAAKVHETSTEVYRDVIVTSATAQKVTMHACVDGSGIQIADASGKPITLKRSAHPRGLLTYNVYLYDAKYGGWLVSETIVPNPVKPC
jgi:hypothetical protein